MCSACVYLLFNEQPEVICNNVIIKYRMEWNGTVLSRLCILYILRISYHHVRCMHIPHAYVLCVWNLNAYVCIRDFFLLFHLIKITFGHAYHVLYLSFHSFSILSCRQAFFVLCHFLFIFFQFGRLTWHHRAKKKSVFVRTFPHFPFFRSVYFCEFEQKQNKQKDWNRHKKKRRNSNE